MGRGRRSQAERTAETRAKVIAAVVESVNEVGYARSTAAQITRRAGVTWGAVQHHFGGKDDLYLAVVEHSFADFASRLDGLPVEGANLEKRAALFIDAAWAHFSGPEYRAAFEILRSEPGREDLHPESSWQVHMFRAWDRIWMQLFGGAAIPRRRHHVLQHYTISVLSGLSSTLALEGEAGRLRPSELELLVQTLARELNPRSR